MIELQILGYNIKDQLISLLQNYIGLGFKRNYLTQEGEIYIFIGQSYVWRTDSDLTSPIIIQFIHTSEAVCTILTTGGGSGLCSFSWGAHGSNERTIANKINRLSTDNGWAVKYLKE